MTDAELRIKVGTEREFGFWQWLIRPTHQWGPGDA
jgi:hypothetical protein